MIPSTIVTLSRALWIWIDNDRKFCVPGACYGHTEVVVNVHILATAFQLTGRAHYYENRFPEALDAMKGAWKYAELSGSERQFNCAGASPESWALSSLVLIVRWLCSSTIWVMPVGFSVEATTSMCMVWCP